MLNPFRDLHVKPRFFGSRKATGRPGTVSLGNPGVGRSLFVMILIVRGHINGGLTNMPYCGHRRRADSIWESRSQETEPYWRISGRICRHVWPGPDLHRGGRARRKKPLTRQHRENLKNTEDHAFGLVSWRLMRILLFYCVFLTAFLPRRGQFFETPSSPICRRWIDLRVPSAGAMPLDFQTHSSSAFFQERCVATERTVNFEPSFRT